MGRRDEKRRRAEAHRPGRFREDLDRGLHLEPSPNLIPPASYLSATDSVMNDFANRAIRNRAETIYYKRHRYN